MTGSARRARTRSGPAGKVTIDRSDLAARGDSLWLRTGKDGKGSMIGGQPTLRGFGKDTFDLTGKRIDFTLDEKDLTGIMALDSAHAVTGDVDLTGDTVSIALKEKKAELTPCLGPHAHARWASPATTSCGATRWPSTRPRESSREVRAFFNAWAGTKPDSGSGERDWVAGDTVIVRFVESDSAGTKTDARCSSSRRMDSARSFYRAVDKGKAADSTKKAEPSLNYARADRIVVTHGDQPATEAWSGWTCSAMSTASSSSRARPSRLAIPPARRGAQRHPGRARAAAAARQRQHDRAEVLAVTAIEATGTGAVGTGSLVEGIGLSKSFRGRASWTTCRCRSGRARSSGCWARTARGRPRRST